MELLFCWRLFESYFKYYMVSIFFNLMQELLYLYGFVIDGNTDDYLMVMTYSCIQFLLYWRFMLFITWSLELCPQCLLLFGSFHLPEVLLKIFNINNIQLFFIHFLAIVVQLVLVCNYSSISYFDHTFLILPMAAAILLQLLSLYHGLFSTVHTVIDMAY